MLPALLILAAIVIAPVIIGLCVRGDPDNAVRHESGEPGETRVKHR